MIYESTRKMTPNEQMAYGLGYNKAKAESVAQIEGLNELNLFDLHQTGKGMDMSVGGLPAKTFMAALVAMFETAKATNYLTITVDYKAHHYGITIQKADGEQTPAEKIASLTAQLAAANEENERLAALNDGLNNLPGLYTELQAQLADEKREKIAARREVKINEGIIHSLNASMLTFKRQLAAVQAEKDAAVRDWSEAAQNSQSPKSCIACAHCTDDDGAGGYVCELASSCIPAWRGVPAPSAESEIDT